MHKRGLSMSERTSNYLKGASILVAAGILSRLLGLFFKIPLYQMVGSYGNGIYGNVTSIYNLLLMVSTVGFPVAISKMVSESIAKNEYATAHRVLNCRSSSWQFWAPYPVCFCFLAQNGSLKRLTGRRKVIRPWWPLPWRPCLFPLSQPFGAFFRVFRS